MTFDFDGIKLELTNRLSLLSDWVATLFFGVYERILDVIAYIIEKMVYIAEFYYREATWKTAQKKESLMNLAMFLSYYTYRKKAASGEISIASDSTFGLTTKYLGQDTIIPRWTAFSNDGGDVTVFSTEALTYYRNTVGPLTINVKEGVPKEYLYIAQGTVYEEIYLYSDSIDNDEYEVLIVNDDNETLYTGIETPELYYINDTTDYYYQVTNSTDFNSVILKFGDGITTKKLESGTRVFIKYATTQGDKGDITATEIISKISDTITDIYGTEKTFYVKNEEEIADGTDIETLENIRQNARNLFQTGGRCGTSADWKAVLDSVSFISNSSVWSIEDLGGSTLIEDQNAVYLTALTIDGTALTTAQKSDLETDYLKPKKTITEAITWYDLEKVYARFVITAKILSTATDTIVSDELKSVLNAAYASTNVDFQTNLYESNFTGIVDNIDNVFYHTTAIYNLEQNLPRIVSSREIIPSKTSDDDSDAENQIYLLENSLEIFAKIKTSGTWVDPVSIAQDISGVITSNYPLIYSISGSINYTDNTFSYSVTGGTIISGTTQNPGASSPNGYLIDLSYKTKDGNGNMTNDLRLAQRWQITDVDDDYVETTLNYV